MKESNLDFNLERREKVSFNSFYFKEEKNRGKEYPMGKTFSLISSINLWGAQGSVSGEGSTERQTGVLKDELPKLFNQLNIEQLLDAPCGDFGWLGSIEFPIKKYVGVDILDDCISKLQKQYSDKLKYEFMVADISTGLLPTADLILCRDCLVHFSYEDISKTLFNFKRSKSQYLLTTTFTKCTQNTDIITGDWRTINLELEPFNFPKPKNTIVEQCVESGDLYDDKSLALWDLNDILGLKAY